MKRIYIVILLLAAIRCAAADFWQTKPFTDWTKKDVEKITTDSPWAQTIVLRKANMVQVRREFGRPPTLAGDGEGIVDPEVSYAVCLRTSRPIREALVRANAIEQKYEQMDSSAKAQFDQKWSTFLAQQPTDKIIFHVTYSSNTTDVDRQLASFWQSQTLDTLLVDTYMNTPDGKRIAPIAFWAGKGGSREFQVAFPRPKNSSGKATFSLEFKHPDVTQQPSSRIAARFSIKELEYKGEITY